MIVLKPESAFFGFPVSFLIFLNSLFFKNEFRKIHAIFFSRNSPGAGYTGGSQLNLEQEDSSITAGSTGPQKERTLSFEIFIFQITCHIRLHQGFPLRSWRSRSLTTVEFHAANRKVRLDLEDRSLLHPCAVTIRKIR